MKLERMVDDATIIACRQKVDFYYWKGIPVARKWPRKSSVPRTAAEIRSSENFAAAAKWTSALSVQLVNDYKNLIEGRGVTWVDMQRGLMLGKPWISVTPLGDGP